MHCARFSLEADTRKMGVFVIETLVEALLLKIVWHMANIVWHMANIVWHMANIVWHIFVYFCYDILQFIVHDFLFLGEFVKVRKATNSFVMSCHVMSARLSVSVEQLRYHWTDIR